MSDYELTPETQAELERIVLRTVEKILDKFADTVPNVLNAQLAMSGNIVYELTDTLSKAAENAGNGLQAAINAHLATQLRELAAAHEKGQSA